MAKVTFLANCLAYLKSDEKSVVTRVVFKAQKVCKNALRDGAQVINNCKFETENTLDSLKDKLEDAKVALRNSYYAIELDKCKGADQIDGFIANTYLKNIAAKLNAIKDLEKQIKAAEEFQEETIKNVNESLALYNAVMEVLQIDEADVDVKA